MKTDSCAECVHNTHCWKQTPGGLCEEFDTPFPRSAKLLGTLMIACVLIVVAAAVGVVWWYAL